MASARQRAAVHAHSRPPSKIPAQAVQRSGILIINLGERIESPISAATMPPSASGVIPEPWFTYLALIVSSLTIGYWVGVGNSLGYTRGGSRSKNDSSASEEEVDDWKDQSDSELEYSGKLASLATEDTKLVLVVRTDLEMTKGKIAAQCCHATLACYKDLKHSNPAMLRVWERGGQAKIALKLQKNECDSEEDEMLLLKAQARSLGLCAQDIRDAGRTQIAAGSRTVLGIGPGPVRLIDQVTRHLKLL
ncbi:hypothetical protein O181_040573 [Austropuccinia psidii MF-1]|uniref:peptidyl-tRNA hydrolase n=1 Tax=Austropuccinia psidii MF-1 TaxID=1389203 RepID=A0A9Q3HCZ8_9BASI|nr:hypothetical protein [Austropuccinia psidii MF-1]